MKRNIVNTTLIFLISACLNAQDYHYWAEQFGAEPTLMGGAAVAGVRDNSAIFYNPGAMGFIEGNSLSVNANIYKFQLTRFDNALGDDINLKYDRYYYYPQMLSGMLDLFKNKRFKLSYILMTRYNSRLLFHKRNVISYDVIESIGGNEDYLGEFDYHNEFNEQWGGVGLGYKLSDHVSLGITQFVTYRYHSYRFSLAARAIPLTDTIKYFVSSISESQDLSSSNWHLLWKLGLALDYGKWKFGLALTTPNVNFYGNVDIQNEISFYNVGSLLGSSIFNDFLAFDRQDDIKMNTRSPLSISGGIRYESERTAIELAAEYYFKIKLYDIVDPEPRYVIYPRELFNELIGEIKFLRVKGWAEEVLNISAGIKQALSHQLDYHLGFRTDFNYFSQQNESYDGIVMIGRTWDLYHLSTGLSWKMNKSKITAGLEYTFGWQKNIDQYVNFSTPKASLGLQGEQESNMHGYDHGLALIIGFTYYFSSLLDLDGK